MEYLLTGIPDSEGAGGAGGAGQEAALADLLLGRSQSDASMEGEGEEGEELAGEDALAFLRSQPQFAQMRQVT